MSEDTEAKHLLDKAAKENLETALQRSDKMQLQCGFGELGLCCRICLQGPCIIDPFGEGPKRGICGAQDYTIVIRHLIRMIAGGCAAHSYHGRHLVYTLLASAEGKVKAYSVKDEQKLKAVASRIGLAVEGKNKEALGKELALKALEDYSRLEEYEPCSWLRTTLTKRRLEILDRCDVLPYNIDATVTETMHCTTMGVDADPVPLLFDGIKTALADLAGEHISTDISDILFGIPKIIQSEANLGAIEEDKVNIAVHGHNPILSEVICEAISELENEAKAAGAKGINIVGICCTGNEVLMRRGIKLAANFATQELAILTGALDAIVVDYQCIMPSLPVLAQCYHTKIITTMPIARIAGSIHLEFSKENAIENAKFVIRLAIEAYKNRNKARVDIPKIKQKVFAGFSYEQILEILAKVSPNDPLQYLVDKIKEGKILGVALLTGCNNLKIPKDYGHLTVAKELIKNNTLVVATGCAAGAFAKADLLTPEATLKYAGEGLKEVLTDLGEKLELKAPLPPILHFGSCVDNSRVEDFATALANKMNIDIMNLPVVASAPEGMSEKAVATGTWLVATGWPVHVGLVPWIYGSKLVTQIAENTARDVYGGYFIFENDSEKAAKKLVNILKHRRWKLGIEEDEEIVYWTGETAKELFAVSEIKTR